MSETLTNGVIVPDKGSRDWYADLRSNWLKLDSLMAGGNITINPAQTEGVLVATITVGGKEYKLYQQDGDVSVKIDPSAENAEYPLVASTSAEANTGSVVMAPAVTVNPSTGAVTATSFKGKLDGNASTATNATKAMQDGAGAVITDTYATKSELGSKADDDNVVHKSGNETINGFKTFTSETVNTSLHAFRHIRGNYGTFWRQDGADLYLMLTNAGDPYGDWNDFRPLAVNLATGICNISGNANTATSANDPNAVHKSDQIMLAQNLLGANITPGGVVDCGNGNGKLKLWYLGADGTFLLSDTLPTGVWKSASFVTLAPNEGGMFIKIG